LGGISWQVTAPATSHTCHTNLAASSTGFNSTTKEFAISTKKCHAQRSGVFVPLLVYGAYHRCFVRVLSLIMRPFTDGQHTRLKRLVPNLEACSSLIAQRRFVGMSWPRVRRPLDLGAWPLVAEILVQSFMFHDCCRLPRRFLYAPRPPASHRALGTTPPSSPQPWPTSSTTVASALESTCFITLAAAF
jgi:hypothetical protein